MLGKHIPTSFLPNEDQGYAFAGIQLPDASSAQRTSEVMRQAEEILKNTPGVKYYSSVIGYNMLSGVQNTYSGFSFHHAGGMGANAKNRRNNTSAIMMHLKAKMAAIPGAIGVCLFAAGDSRASARRAASRLFSKTAPARAEIFWRTI